MPHSATIIDLVHVCCFSKTAVSLYHSVLAGTLPAENAAQFNRPRPNNGLAITNTVRLAISIPVSIVFIVLLCCACGICCYRRRHQQAIVRHQAAQPPPPRQPMQYAIHTPVNQPSATASQPPATQPPEQQQEPTAPELTGTAPPNYDQAKDHTTITLNGESETQQWASESTQY